jgi:uncharacterized surface protein with fasciclin (FAS1) repeats
MSVLRRTLATLAVTGLTAAGSVVALTPAPASADETTTSLAEVLAADGNKLDRDQKDFDVLDRVVRAVLAAKPDSPVAVLADGTQTLTAFLPTDQAFRRLARDLVGADAGKNERTAFKSLAGAVDADTLETVLLYHVVVGQKLDSGIVAESDGAMIETAQGGDITVNVDGKKITIGDLDPTDTDPRVTVVDINSQANQLGHAINRVLRPADL